MAATDLGDKMNELNLIKYNLFKEQNPENGRFDVAFEVGGKLLYAHKLMLTLVSPTFDSMLSERWTKKEEPIKIKDYCYDNFYQFITFLYTAKCELTETNISSMVDMAEFYGVPLFKEYCDEYLSSVTITTDNIFSLIDLVDKYSLVELKDSVLTFLTGYFEGFAGSDGFLKLHKSIIRELIIALKYTVKPEDLFQAVYKWSENQATNKQLADPNLNLQDATKAEITDFLPHIIFRRMGLKFLHEFVVPLGFIFPSLNDLSKILCEQEERIFRTNVKITNANGQTLHGIISDKTVIENIKSLKASTCSHSINLYCYWNTRFNIPTTPSSLKKRDGIKWYLVFSRAGQMFVIISGFVNDNYYLLAELTPGSTGFDTTDGCKIEIQ